MGLEAGPERGHKISRLLFLGLRCNVDLFALTFGLDHLAERVAIGVFVLLGLPVAGKVVDELLRHFQLALLDANQLRSHLLGRAHLVREIELLERDRPLTHPQCAQILPVPHHELCDRRQL